MQNKTVSYKGFYIQPDKLLNFSLLDSFGKWCCSKSTAHAIKLTINQIIIARIANNPQQLTIIHHANNDR